MTVVVTGAAGHVGGNLVRTLLAQGREVRALVHEDRRALEGLEIETAQGDVRDLESLLNAFGGAEVVYHLASLISLRMDEWPLLEQVNVVGVRNVIEACRQAGVRRLVYFSSIHALEQEPLDMPIDETRALVSLTSRRYPPYDRSKAAAQREVRAAVAQGLDAVIVNPTGIVGPLDFRPSHFGEVLLALSCGRMPAFVDAGFDWVDVRDVIAGAMRAEEVAPAGAEYLLSGHWLPMCDLARMVEEISGARSPLFYCPLGLAEVGTPFAAAWARLTGKRPLFGRASLNALRGNRNISHTRAARELGYAPRPFRETLEDTLEWFAQARASNDLPWLSFAD